MYGQPVVAVDTCGLQVADKVGIAGGGRGWGPSPHTGPVATICSQYSQSAKMRLSSCQHSWMAEFRCLMRGCIQLLAM